MAEKKKWLKWRHRAIRWIGLPILYVYTKLKYGIRITKFKEQGKRPYLIVMNHQTAFDQFFVEFAFRGAIYYIASEDLFSKGFLSSVIRYLVAPIPIKKQTTDVRAVMNSIRVMREGGTICLAPEGNRTFHGKPVYMKPAIAGLARKLGLPIALFRIEGGYGVQPRWSDVVRKGTMRAYVSEVIEPEEVKTMTDNELFERIRSGLDVDETKILGEYRHKKSAEYLERVVYVCPDCGLSEFESCGDVVTCKKCGKQIRYLPNKELLGVNCDFPFRFVADWYEYQETFIHGLDETQYCDQPMYRDAVQLSEVILYKRKQVMEKDAVAELYGNRIVVNDRDGRELLTLPFDKLSVVTVLGRNKLNLYFGEHVYQFKSHKRFNALKYMNLFYHYKNKNEGDGNGKFLGL